jgi:hypothetical protein
MEKVAIRICWTVRTGTAMGGVAARVARNCPRSAVDRLRKVRSVRTSVLSAAVFPTTRE